MKTAKFIKKTAGAMIAILLAVILTAVSLPLAVNAAIDDVFEIGNLIYYVTAEGSGSEPGAVTAAFNENIDPETVTSIKIPGTVDYEGKSYNVTAIVSNAFASCSALTTLDMSECTKLTEIGMSAFFECVSLNSILVPCNFDAALFTDTGVLPDGDVFTVEYSVAGEGGGGISIVETEGGTLAYIHDWQLYSKNNAEHICTICSAKGKHDWKADADNPSQHKCTVCKTTEQHYGGTPDCQRKADCAACGTQYQTAKQGTHTWNVMPETIGSVTADYGCSTCRKTETKEIKAEEIGTEYSGQKLKLILQDPYKVLPESVQLKVDNVELGTEKYDRYMAELDDCRKVEGIALFEIELFNAKGERINGEIAGKVRILIQIPDGWDKKDLEAVLIMSGADVEFEESVITIDGVDYIAFWTNHFSPYAIIRKTAKTDIKSPLTGSPDFETATALAAASISAAMIVVIVIKRKRKED